jgi:glycosyltransferase involved in cell wall biosynthesis
MRVLHLYAGNLFGGVERTLLALWHARGACPRMHPHFALSFDAKLATDLRAAGAPVTILGSARASRPWTTATARNRVHAFLKDNPFDVVVTHGLWPHGVFGPGVRRADVPLVLWLHDVPSRRGWNERWARRTRPDLLLMNSNYTKYAALDVFPGWPCELQYPPVELPSVADPDEVRRAVRESLGTDGYAYVIVLAARLQPTKGHAVLLEALSRLRPRDTWRCWLAGGAQRASEHVYLNQLQARAKRLGIAGSVRFLGHRDDVPRLLAAADLMCQPNTEPEGFGIALVEAMAMGVPVITSDIGAAREILDRRAGTLVPPKDFAALAVAIESQMNLKSMRNTSGRARAAKLCGADEALPRLAKLLERVGAGRRAPA